MYDIVIIGCGPAGMSAAIYALRAGKTVLLLEKETIGGKISSSPLVENYPGFKQISGASLSDQLFEQVTSLGGKIEIEEVTGIVPGKIKEIITEDGIYRARAIVLATGTTYKKLNIDKEEEMIGNGVSFCTVCDGAFYKGKDVAVVGGGNSALISALSLSEICKTVYLLVRKDFLKGEEKRITDVLNQKNIKVLYHTKVKELVGDIELTSIVIEDGEEKILPVTGLFLSIGQLPATEAFKNNIDLTEYKYIKSSEDCTTNEEGIFVAGDCRDKKIRQLTTAMNDGTVAALGAIAYIKELDRR